jgi:hypothetical protein
VITAETRHFERIGDTAAGFVRQLLQFGIDVIVRDEYGLLALEERADTLFQFNALLGGRRVGHACPSLSDAADGTLRPVELDLPDHLIHDFLGPADGCGKPLHMAQVFAAQIEKPRQRGVL